MGTGGLPVAPDRAVADRQVLTVAFLVGGLSNAGEVSTMRRFSSALVVTLAALLGGCASTCCGSCSSPDAQAVVEAIAKANPDCTRLTVHCTPAGAAGPIACASTAPAKKGKPSDPEDVKAMATGQTVVLEEGDALDVTVPIRAKDGKFLSACGVTLKTAGMSRDQVVAKATSIAKDVEAKIGDCCTEGACCADGACCAK